jgi:2-dehydropantoate 2-reductase
MTTSKPRFAIMGSGGVGGYFGARLSQADFDTTFVARGAHLAAIRQFGLRVDDCGKPFAVSARAAGDTRAIGTVDFVLFAVKLWDVAEAGAACRPVVGPETAAISLLNGIDSEEILSSVLGPRHVMGGVAEISATIAEPGLIKKVSPFSVIRFGELDRSRSLRAQRLADALLNAGIEAEISEDINIALWKKFVFLTGLSALTALTRHGIGDVRADPDTRSFLAEVMTEALRVGQAAGVSLEDDTVAESLRYIDGLKPETKASMTIDLMAGRRIELPWLSGAVVRKGAELGISTPANRFVCVALKLDVGGAKSDRT